MSRAVVNAAGADLLDSLGPARREMRKRLRRERSELYSDEDGFDNSINPLLVVSGPRGGAVSVHDGDADLRALVGVVDDNVFHVVKEAWAAVAVPADTYWNCPRRLHAGEMSLALLRHSGAGDTSAAVPRPLRIPHPRNTAATFYNTRVEGLAARGYAPHRGLVPVALDRKGGTGSKAFNVLHRWEDVSGGAGVGAAGASSREETQRVSGIARFVSAIPRPAERNLYVLVDEACPIDPFFDVDFSYDPACDDTENLLALTPGGAADVGGAVIGSETVEKALWTVLTALQKEMESEWDTVVQECLVLTSSMQLGRHTGGDAAVLENLKISFHVHFRFADRAVVQSVTDLHAFMVRLRAKWQGELQEMASRSDPDDRAATEQARLLLRLVDFGVYTHWRAFRLPYNVKAPTSHSSKQLADGAGDDLLAEQLRQLDLPLPDIQAGHAAPAALHNVILAADAQTCKEQRYLVERLSTYYRFLLPLLPEASQFALPQLEAFLAPLLPERVRAAVSPATEDSQAAASRETISAWVMDMACIIRDASQLPSAQIGAAVVAADDAAVDAQQAFRLLKGVAEPVAAAASSGATASTSPFDIPMPPRPRCVRIRVDDMEVKRLLAEVFWCLAPEYSHVSAPHGERPHGSATFAPGSAITPERINAQYEESIRAYYVFQKQNKYCIRQHRTHKATYAQLYLTFGSIKVRCYSNDCCDRCCVIPWEATGDSSTDLQFDPGYPRYDRLVAIRNELFPPLPAGELVRRYGTAVLQQSL